MDSNNVSNNTNVDNSYTYQRPVFDYSDPYFGIPTQKPLPPRPIGPEDIATFFVVVPLTVIMSLFGMTTNIINMVVFHRQGFLADNCTPSFVGLAMTDFCCCVLSCTEAFIKIPIGFRVLILRYNAMNVYYKNIATMVEMPIPMLKQMTCWVTAYLSFERMISVTLPFKVRALFTPARFYVIIASILLACFGLYVPQVFNFKLAPSAKYGNKVTLSRLIPADIYLQTDLTNDVIMRIASVGSIILFNIIIIIKVNASRRFRSLSTSSSKLKKNDNTTISPKTELERTVKKNSKSDTKETKLIRMMVAISSIVVLCYVPSACLVLFTDVLSFKDYFSWRIVPYLKPTGIFVELVNSCINIFIYFALSSKYRQTLRQLLSRFKGKP